MMRAMAILIFLSANLLNVANLFRTPSRQFYQFEICMKLHETLHTASVHTPDNTLLQEFDLTKNTQVMKY